MMSGLLHWRIVGLMMAIALVVPVRGFAESLSPTRPIEAGFSAERLGWITNFFKEQVASGKIPGAIIRVQRRGQTAYYEAFGVRDPKTKEPMTADTIFSLFSMTKPITSVAAMLLVERGKLSLSDDLGKFIPAYYDIKVGVEVADKEGKPSLGLVAARRPITVHDLMRQSAGMPYASLAYGVVKPSWDAANLLSPDQTNQQLITRIATLPLLDHPGSTWVYGHATDVLGGLIEMISGQSLYKFEKQYLLDPLGMTNTSFFVTDPAKQKLIAEPLPVEDFHRDPRIARNWESGGGGMVSSINDYSRFLQMLLNGGMIDGKQIMGRKTIEFMTANHIMGDSGVQPGAYYYPGAGYGFGLGFAVRTEVGTSRWPGSVGAYEWSGGSGVYFFVDPKEDMYAILMMQTERQRGRIQSAFKNMIYGAIEK